MSLRGKAAVVGFSELPTLRNYPGRTTNSLCSEAIRLAIADAGLKVEDIDGITTYPNAPYGNAQNIAGYDMVDDVHLSQILPFKNIRWSMTSTNRMAVTSIREGIEFAPWRDHYPENVPTHLGYPARAAWCRTLH